jgi:PAS domain S-box-containing protein
MRAVISSGEPVRHGAGQAEPTAAGTGSTVPPPLVGVIVTAVGLVGLIAWWFSGGLALLAYLLLSVVVLGGVGLLVAREAQWHAAACALAERAAQDALEDRDRLLKVIDNTSAVIYMRDDEGRYLLINREYERLFGVKRDEVTGLTDHDLFPKAIADAFRANDLRALHKGAPVVMEETAPHPDGSRFYITVKYPVTDYLDRPYAICGISTDITDLKRAEEQVRRLNAELELRVHDRTSELEASTRELDSFAYSVSHDLRAPLRALDGFSQVLLDDYGRQIDTTGRDYLRRIQAATRRMAGLIDDLLDLSRATRAELVRQPVNLSALARDVVSELERADPERQTEIVIQEGLTCPGDSELLRLVLQNLLSNAWKFTSKRPDGRIEVGSADRDGLPAFYVRDNGAGFDMAHAEKLFVPFQRLHSAADFEGNGVGLAIVARILNRHGGRAWAEGEPGRGATFFFVLGPAPTDTP